MAPFVIIALVLIITGIGVVVAHNPINSALCLITNMMCVAALFALLDAHFLAAVQIVVYAGAVMVLVLFVLMLLNLKSEVKKDRGLFFVSVCVLAGASFLMFGLPIINDSFAILPDKGTLFVGDMNAIGKELYTNYLFPFEAASILLMAAIAGAVMLAKKKVQ